MSASKLLLPGCLCVMTITTYVWPASKPVGHRLGSLEQSDIVLLVHAPFDEHCLCFALTAFQAGFARVFSEEVVR